ncbi:protein DOWN-REGULATED IN DIF1 11-like [Abrus precatorius]|uniref:Protein DOWN-REGULATED IN DIF1 11-like n=1 Tax=Abrus precatorius TaxID=3816 RepID=A0A8B8ML47_ABRPR|nr:protein DOWN-REGULATED IN DIF1 11-like [Abrus precatorius]
MGIFRDLCVIAVFLSNFTLMVTKGFSKDVLEVSNGPSVEINYAPRPLSTYERYLNNCAVRLNSDCGDEIFSAIFFGKEIVNRDCCVQLVNDVGKQCHDDMTKYILRLPKFKTNKAEILARSERIWSDCVYLDVPLIEPVGADIPLLDPIDAES